jgi:hypothetical protein
MPQNYGAAFAALMPTAVDQPKKWRYERSMSLPTPRDYLRLHRVDVCCLGCDHIVELDLAALIAGGHGDTPLTRLPLRCTACGSTGHRHTTRLPPTTSRPGM